MGIDSSIYFQQQATPDITGAIANGLKMRDMIRQNQAANRDQAFQQSLRSAYQVDPNTGAVSFNPASMKDLVAIDPMRANELAMQQRQAQMQRQEMDLKTATAKAELGGRVAGEVETPEQAAAARNYLKAHGFDDTELPGQNFDKTEWQKFAGRAQTYQQKVEAMTAKQTADAKTEEAKAATSKAATEAAGLPIKQQEASNKKQELNLEFRKLYGGSGAVPALGAANADADPATLVPGLVPQHHQAKAFGEIEAAQNTVQNAGKILQSFDSAANNLHGADFVPGMQNADQKSLHALLGPTFKDVEGTVRQAAMDNMNNNITPQFGDSKETIAKKRAALIGYLQSKASAPTAKAYGIDLGKFSSTTLDPALAGGRGVARTAAAAPAADYHSMSDDELKAAYQKRIGGASANAR